MGWWIVFIPIVFGSLIMAPKPSYHARRNYVYISDRLPQIGESTYVPLDDKDLLDLYDVRVSSAPSCTGAYCIQKESNQ